MISKLINFIKKKMNLDKNKIVGFKYSPHGVCPKELTLIINSENKTIEDISFNGGCSGNHKGICALIKGMDIEEASNKLEGIKCGNRDTSCPDQLSKALKEVAEFFNKQENKEDNV